MESWRHTFRVGFAPQMSRLELLYIHTALEYRDPELCQGATVRHQPIGNTVHTTITATDPVTFGARKVGRVSTVAEVEDLFSDRCAECDQRLGEPAGCRWFLNWWDETPIAEARRLLADEVYYVLFVLHGGFSAVKDHADPTTKGR